MSVLSFKAKRGRDVAGKAETASQMRFILRSFHIAVEAFRRFVADDGWAIASNIALSMLMAMFPFFLVLTALAGIFGSKDLADEAARLVLEAWPQEVAAPIAREIHTVLSGAHGQLLTISAMLSLYFASSGIESLRIGLNRAYNGTDPRSFLLLRLESIGYVLVSAVALLALSFLVVLAPLIWRTVLHYVPAVEPFYTLVTVARYAIATILLIVVLTLVHLWLPAGKRRLREVAPGSLVTLVLWLLAGAAFGRYLADYAFTYSVTYAGLASPMIALVFLYVSASIFVYGGELNSVIVEERRKARAP
jgi:membrane protein